MSPLDLLFAATAWAAGGGEHHTPTIDEVIFPAINFIIYAALLYFFALPALRSFLRSRRDEVPNASSSAGTSASPSPAAITFSIKKTR